MVIRGTHFLRRLWRAITASANASDKRSKSRAAFSNRDSVGCDANKPPVIGSRPPKEPCHWIVGHSRGVVAVGIAAGDREQALQKQLLKRMDDLRLLTIDRQTRRQCRNQLELLVARLEQNRSTVGTGVGLSNLATTAFLDTFSNRTLRLVVSYGMQKP